MTICQPRSCTNKPTLIHPKGKEKKPHIQAFWVKVINNKLSTIGC